MNSITKQQLDDFSEVYPKVLELSMAKNSPFDKLKVELEAMFDKYQIAEIDKSKMLSQALLQMCSQITSYSQQTALAIIKEAFANETEKKKPQLLDRQQKEFDDKLRIKKAELLANMYGMTASGGLTVPERLSTEVFKKIEEILK